MLCRPHMEDYDTPYAVIGQKLIFGVFFMAKDTRSRTWTFLVYPESAPENWRNLLDEQHIAWVESPLHDRDINPTGEPKKAHYHILLVFEGKKSYDQILEIISCTNGTIPQRVNNQRSMVRYFAHIDNPDKAQYNITELVCHGGIDIGDLLTVGSGQKQQFIKEMMDFVRDHDIEEFYELADYAREYNEDWFNVLIFQASYVLEKYIKSNRQRRTKERLQALGSDST